MANFLIIVVALAVTIDAAYLCWQAATDFSQYYLAAKLYTSGQTVTLYDPRQLSDLEHKYFPSMPVRHQNFPELPADPIPFWYPPYAIPVFAWLALFSPYAAMYVWTCLGLVALLFSFVVLHKAFGVSKKALTSLWCLIAVTGPYVQAIILGQPIFFILLAFCLSIYGFKSNRMWLATLGLCFMVPKPTLALPVVAFLLGAGRYKVVFGAVCFGVLLLVVSFLTTQPETYPKYLELMAYAAKRREIHGLWGHLTLNGQLTRLFPAFQSSFSILVYAAYGMALLYIGWLGWRFRRSRNWLEAGLIGGLPLVLLASPYCHPYDLLILLPAVCCYDAARFMPLFRFEREVLLISFLVLFVFLIYTSIYFAKVPINVHFLWYAAFAGILTAHVIKNRDSSYFAAE